MNYFFTSLPKVFIKCFSKQNLFWHFIAIFLTYILVVTNFDWYYFTNTRSIALNYIFFPAIIFGGLLPIIIPLCLIFIGHIKKQKNTYNLGWLLGQSAILGSFISSIYKAFTGRIQPDMHNTLVNISHNFQFGFFKHGVFWGWPSSHTTVAFAMSFVLIGLFPKNKIVKILALVYAIYIGIGVSLSIHWFSDFIAGAIIGTIIGISVIKYYKK